MNFIKSHGYIGISLTAANFCEQCHLLIHQCSESSRRRQMLANDVIFGRSRFPGPLIE